MISLCHKHLSCKLSLTICTLLLFFFFYKQCLAHFPEICNTMGKSRPLHGFTECHRVRLLTHKRLILRGTSDFYFWFPLSRDQRQFDLCFAKKIMIAESIVHLECIYRTRCALPPPPPPPPPRLFFPLPTAPNHVLPLCSILLLFFFSL